MNLSLRFAGTVVTALALLAVPLVTVQGQGGAGPRGSGAGGGQSGGRGSAGGGGTPSEEGYGNNLSFPAVFAEGYGLLGLPTSVDTGLRPRLTDPYPNLLEYFDPLAVYVKDGVGYFPQQTTSHWQAGWVAGTSGAPEFVDVNWSDNLTHQRWTARSVVRVETVLEQTGGLMTAYPMTYLFGSGATEMQGTSGVSFQTTERTVYTIVARLRIEKLLEPGGDVDPTVPAINEAIYEGFGADGPGAYGAEVNVAGKLIYGYNWMLNSMPLTMEQKVGWWRLTFSLDPQATYAITPEAGDPVPYIVPRNALLTSLDPLDLLEEVLFKPTLPDAARSVLEIEITARRVSKKPTNPGRGGGS